MSTTELMAIFAECLGRYGWDGQSVLWGAIGASATVVLVELFRFVWRFVRVAPKQIHNEALALIRRVEKERDDIAEEGQHGISHE